jgi:hypothetical protein
MASRQSAAPVVATAHSSFGSGFGSSGDRFNLLLLEDGEYYFRDHACYYWKDGRRWVPCTGEEHWRCHCSKHLLSGLLIESLQGGGAPQGVQREPLLCSEGHPGATASRVIQAHHRY